MAKFPSGFSERMFEFAFNAEYADKHKAVIVGCPSLPTQNAEKALGYDVEFAIAKAGGVTHYLALQHKVARFVDGTNWKNKKFVAAVGSPYFAVGIDPVQFNLIEEVATAAPSYVSFYYCVPRFHGLATINGHYLVNSVEASSLWVDVANLGPLDPDETHTLVYSSSGGAAYFFSDHPKEVKLVVPSQRPLGNRATRPTVTLDQAYGWIHEQVAGRYASVGLRNRLGDHPTLPSSLPKLRPSDSKTSVASALGTLVAEYLNSSLLAELRGS